MGTQVFLRKTGHFQEELCLSGKTGIFVCLHEQVGDTIVDGWPQFECNFNVFADMILPYISPVSSRPKPTHQEWYCVKGSEGDLAQPVFWHLWWLGW